jgi:glycerophosphoryl diester phosphodiesterase
MDSIRFVRIGHAGAGGAAPPNTLRSIELALQLDVDVVEVDVRRCRDAVVLHHDATVCDGLSRPLVDCRLDELKALDVGEGERIPTLSEAVSRIRGRALIHLDLKEEGYEAELLDVLREQKVQEDTLISSSSPASLRAIKSLAPEVLAGFSYPTDGTGVSAKPYGAPIVAVALRLMRLSAPRQIVRKIAAGADATMLQYTVISLPLVRTVHAAGHRVFAWTVDDLETMQGLQAMGVDGVISNRLDVLAQLRQRCAR